MPRLTANGATSNIERMRFLQDGTGANPGYGFTGLTSATSGLNISTQCDNEASATTYTSAGSTIDTITTIGTYQTPTTSHCRIKAVDGTNEPGEYELQFADARYAVSSAKWMRITISGVMGMIPKVYTVQLTGVNLNDAVRAGLTAIPNVASGSAGALPVTDANGNIPSNVLYWKSNAVPATSVNGVPIADTKYFNGNLAAFTAGGILDVNVKNYNTHAVTTDANNYPNVNLTDVGGSNLSTTAAQIGVNVVNFHGQPCATDGNGYPSVNLVDINGVFNPATAGYIAPDWSQVHGATSTVDLTNTTIKGIDAVTFPAVVASPTNITGGTITTVTNLTNAPTAGDLTAAMKASLNASTPASVGSVAGAVGSVTGSVGSVTGAVGSVTGAVGSVTGNVGGNVVGSVASVTAGVTVTTNNDKTGYSLTQSFPSNFSALAITVGGAVTAGTVSDKTGYSLAVGSIVTATFGTCDFTATMKTSLNAATPTVTISSSDTTAILVVGVKAKTDLIATNAADSPNAVTGQTTVSATNAAANAIELVTNKLETMLEADPSNPGKYRETVAALVNAPSGGGGGGLSGPSSVSLTFHDAANNPIQNVELSVVGQGVGPRSDVNGHSTFGISDGTYTVTAAPVNLTMFANATLVVSGTTALTITGTAAAIPTPGAGQIIGYMYTRDGQANPLPSQTVKFQFLQMVDPNAAGDAWVQINFSKTSDGTTALLTADFAPNAKYRAQIAGSRVWYAFTTPASGPFAIKDVVDV